MYLIHIVIVLYNGCGGECEVVVAVVDDGGDH